MDVVKKVESYGSASGATSKKIVIAETGWPSRGSTREGAVPSLENQRAYVRGFLAAAAAAGYDYYLLEAFDQPWKATAEGEVGGAWGLFDPAGRPKFKLGPDEDESGNAAP